MGNSKMHGFVPAVALSLISLAAVSPVMAQAPSTAMPTVQDIRSPVGDTTALAKEAEGWLADLIKINTTNPPGNEEAAAKYIAGILTKEGITSEFLELAPGRSALVARLRSSAVPDPARALLLVAHMDVVGVDKSKWTVDPFGAVIKDGYMYGRGSIDDKGMLAANLAAFIALKRSNVHLSRDVIFLATADEEEGGEASIRVLIAKYWDKFAAGFAINEGGRVVLQKGKVFYVAVQASEKLLRAGRRAMLPCLPRTTPSSTSPLRSPRLARIPPPFISLPLFAAISNSSLRLKTTSSPSGFARSMPPTAAITHSVSFPRPTPSGIPCFETPSLPPCFPPVCAPM
jgi:hypothetical protein